MLSRIIIIFILLILFLIIIYFRSKFEINHFFYDCKVIYNLDKINTDFDFIFLTDLHEKEFGKDNIDLISFLYQTKIKNIFIGGDFINFTKRGANNNIYFINNTYKLIQSLCKDFNIYYAYGNHELRLKNKSKLDENIKIVYNRFTNFLINNNIKILDNSYIDLTNDIRLYNYNIKTSLYTVNQYKYDVHQILNIKDIESAINKLDKKKFNICLLHNPDFAEILINYGFDLVLSGHHHGGLIRLPILGSILSPEYKLFPKYTKGLYSYKDKYILVSAGLGEHTVRIRLNNKCELNKVSLKKYGTNSI